MKNSLKRRIEALKAQASEPTMPGFRVGFLEPVDVLANVPPSEQKFLKVSRATGPVANRGFRVCFLELKPNREGESPVPYRGAFSETVNPNYKLSKRGVN